MSVGTGPRSALTAEITRLVTDEVLTEDLVAIA
jgi:hypothetical protein